MISFCSGSMRFMVLSQDFICIVHHTLHSVPHCKSKRRLILQILFLASVFIHSTAGGCASLFYSFFLFYSTRPRSPFHLFFSFFLFWRRCMVFLIWHADINSSTAAAISLSLSLLPRRLFSNVQLHRHAANDQRHLFGRTWILLQSANLLIYSTTDDCGNEQKASIKRLTGGFLRNKVVSFLLLSFLLLGK